MIPVAAAYNTIIANGGHYEWRILNGSNTYGITNLISGQIKTAMYEKLSVGNCISAELDLTMWNVTIDATKPIYVQYRATDGTSSSSWYAKGTYYADKIESSPYSEETTVTAFDAMLKAEVAYSLSGGWVATTDKAVVEDIADELGLTIESSTQTLLNTPIAMTNAPNVGPNGVTDREMLSFVASLRGGNWIINRQGQLQLILADAAPANTAAVGDAVDDFDANPVETVERVKVIVDSTTYYLAPSGMTEEAWRELGGRCLEVNLPFYGTQALADSLYTRFGGKSFYPYVTRRAFIDPKYEVGDGVTIKDVTSLIATMEIDIDMLSPAALEYEAEEAIQSLYPYVSPSERNIMYVATKAQETADDAADAASAAQSAADAANAKFGVNLSPYFGHPFDDTYNATSNPSGYWRSKPSASYITKLEDGWAQVVCNNTGSTTLYPIFYNVQNTDITDSTLTMLVELKDVTVSGTAYFWNSDTNGTNVPQYKSSSFAITGATTQRLTLNATNNADPTNFTRSGFQVNAGGSLTCKARVSVYKAGYQGEYIPYVSDAYINSTYREQTIYISKASGTNSVSPNTSWLSATNPSSVPQNAWSTIRPVYNSSYPVLFVATQSQTMAQKGGTACSCTDPVVDQTTTIIDGGHITTGTIDAGVVNVTNINAENITSGYLNSARIAANTITVSKLTGSISNGNWKIDLDNGTFTIGDISASNITTGTLNANNVTISGIISDTGNKNSWNLSTGQFTTTQGKIGGWTIGASDLTASKTTAGTTYSGTLSPTALTYSFSSGGSGGQVVVSSDDADVRIDWVRSGVAENALHLYPEDAGGMAVGHIGSDDGFLVVDSDIVFDGDTGLEISSGTTSGPVLTLGTSTVTVPSASSSQSGVVTTGAQTFEGQKTFAKNPLVGTGTEAVDRFIQVSSNSGSIALESVGNSSGNSNRGLWLGAHGTATAGKWAIRADTDNNVFLGTHSVTGTLTLNYGEQLTRIYFKPTISVDDYTYGLFGLNVGSSTTPTQSRFYFQEESVSTADGATTGYKELYYLPASNTNRTDDASYNILTTKDYDFDGAVKKQIPANDSLTLTMSGSGRGMVITNGSNLNQRGAYIIYQNGSVKAVASASAITTSYSGSTVTFTSTATTVTYLDIIMFNGSIA